MRLNTRENLDLNHATIRNRRTRDRLARRTFAVRIHPENPSGYTDDQATPAWLRCHISPRIGLI